MRAFPTQKRAFFDKKAAVNKFSVCPRAVSAAALAIEPHPIPLNETDMLTQTHYTRAAATLLERLEADGIISCPDSRGIRRVLEQLQHNARHHHAA